jgi:hypothetical protein
LSSAQILICFDAQAIVIPKTLCRYIGRPLLFRTEVKSLNSALLQSQNYTQLDTVQQPGAYQKLASV